MITRYYKLADGTYGVLQSMPAPNLPAGATEVTKAEYDAEIADRKAMVDQKVQDNVDAASAAALTNEAQAADDYAALVAAGIPAATASRLTGHTP
jgi:hypothetical protein